MKVFAFELCSEQVVSINGGSDTEPHQREREREREKRVKKEEAFSFLLLYLESNNGGSDLHHIYVWNRWKIRGAIILSLTLQAILICFSPLRKRTPRKALILLVGSFYILAVWSANFTVALISKSQGKDPKPDDSPQENKLMALWAPFLLVHLGGPDTITAFALEDNALWHRHVFRLVFQAIATIYVVFQSLPNTLWVIILLVFISGTIKYLERTTALYSASLDKFRDSMIQAPDPGPNYAKLMEEYKAKKEARLPTKIILTDEPNKEHRPKKLVHPSKASCGKRKELTHLEIVQYAYKFFNTFKGLVVNLIFNFRERDESLEIFENLNDPEEALRIIEVELGFFYDALFTKTAVLHTLIGTFSRIVASSTLVAAFILFHKKPDKDREFDKTDVMVTYTLFVVGVTLDFISVSSLIYVLRLDCATLGSLKDDPEEALSSLKDRFFNWLLSLRKLHWKKLECYKEGELKCPMVNEHELLATNFFLRRWNGSIKLFNFIAYATNVHVYRIHKFKGFRYFLRVLVDSLYTQLILAIPRLINGIAKLICSAHKWISHGVNETSRKHPWARSTIHPFYFGFLSRIPHFLKSVLLLISEFLNIGEMLDEIHKTVCVHEEPLTKQIWEFMFNELKYKSKFVDTPETARSLSLARGEWTLRANLPENADREKLVCYITNFEYDHSLLIWHIATELCYQDEEEIIFGDDKGDCYSKREFSKILSDYMMYLLITQRGLLSGIIGIWKIRFRDTLAETFRLFHIKDSRSPKVASKRLLEVRCDIDPMDVKGDRSKSVLFDASRLAKDLMEMEKKCGENKWEIVSKVWVELLCYATWHCDSIAHVEQLSRGAEFINFVWPLMVHFRLIDQFQVVKADTRAKLIIGK